MDTLTVIILAAGIGSRMKNLSSVPKALIPVDHLPMVVRIMNTLSETRLMINRFILIVRPIDLDIFQKEVPRYFSGTTVVSYVAQMEEDGYGTAAAVQSLLRQEGCPDEWNMIVNGDTPLLDARQMERFGNTVSIDMDLILGTVFMSDPVGYGRILHDPLRIMEQKEIDLLPPDDERHLVREVNTGIYIIRRDLFQYVSDIQSCPTTGEKKLTDICLFAKNPVCYSKFTVQEMINVNTPLDRNYAEYILFQKRQENIHRSLFTLLRKEMKFP
jgi:bifunctional N-acetylglucosamine-1-phosphate-uridyltransferase/glucosamine-1-phosphate-acetyltransferase GlmU-like protein